jgi:hypothetical protein
LEVYNSAVRASPGLSPPQAFLTAAPDCVVVGCPAKSFCQTLGRDRNEDHWVSFMFRQRSICQLARKLPIARQASAPFTTPAQDNALQVGRSLAAWLRVPFLDDETADVSPLMSKKILFHQGW